MSAENGRDARVLVTGSVAFDHLMSFGGRFHEHILPDKLRDLNVSFLVHELRKRRGGCAANIAYALALHGLRPRLVAAVGPDWTDYQAWLEEHGIDTAPTRVFDRDLTASCFITTDSGSNQITGFFPGAMARAREVSLRDVPGGPAHLAIVSPNDPEAMRLYPRECRALGIPFIYDPGQQVIALDGAALEDGLRGARAIVLNDYEAGVVAKKTGRAPAELLDLAEAVVVTLGERGVRIHARGEAGPIDVPAARVRAVVDPTGAGDSFRGGLMRGLTSGHGWATSARIGALTAAYCIEGGGTSHYEFTPEQFARRYQESFGAPYPLA